MTSPRLTYTFPEAADLLGIGVTKLYGLVADGDIPAVTVGRRSRRIRAIDLERYVASLTDSRGAA